MTAKKYPKSDKWTELEIRQFDAMIDKVESRANHVRVAGRLEMKRFVEKHGMEKCDAMFEAMGYHKTKQVD